MLQGSSGQQGLTRLNSVGGSVQLRPRLQVGHWRVDESTGQGQQVGITSVRTIGRERQKARVRGFQ